MITTFLFIFAMFAVGCLFFGIIYGIMFEKNGDDGFQDLGTDSDFGLF